jgi:membrane-associated protein
MHTLTTLSESLIYIVTFGIVFAETGIIACFFLPGDTLLFSLGLFAHQGIIGLPHIILVLIGASFLGNLFGYATGKYVRIKRESSTLLQKVPESHIQKTELFYKKYGSWAVVLSRFVPIVRTVAPFLAGVSKMPYRRFVILSLLGSLAWSSIVPLVGYLFGSYIDIAYIGYISVGLMLLASIVTPIVLVLSRKYLRKG